MDEPMIRDKKAAHGGFTLAQVEAKMMAVKAAYEADQMDTNSVLKAKWGLIRKAWNAGCAKLPIDGDEMAAFAHAVAAFKTATVAMPIAMASTTEEEIEGFATMTRSYYHHSIPAVRLSQDVTPQMDVAVELHTEDPGEPEAPGLGVGHDYAPGTADGEPLPDPDALGPATPLGDGTPVIQTTPDTNKAPAIDIGGNSEVSAKSQRPAV